MDYVLITGASSGIGYQLAKVFAAHGHSLIITASNEMRLKKCESKLKSEYPVEVISIVQDLSERKAATELYQKIKDRGLTVSILINNAGFGCVGEFGEIPLSCEESMINVNMTALVGLTKLFLLDMKERKSGYILNVASTGAFQPGPFIAVYYASKSFVLNFSRAIRAEYKPYGIMVSTLCPGPTRTNFAMRAQREQVKSAMDPYKVAQIAYEKFRTKEVIIPGVMNRLGQMVPLKIRSRFVFYLQKKLIKDESIV